MIRQALRELRLHPGRFASVITAIVLSIGFLALTQSFVQTETRASALRQAVFTKNADLLVSGIVKAQPTSDSPAAWAKSAKAAAEQVTAKLRAIPGVQAVDKVDSTYGELTDAHDNSHLVTLLSVPDAPELRWNNPVEGRFPTAANEIAIAADMARDAHIKIGDQVSTDGPTGTLKLTVTGLLPEKSFVFSDALVSPRYMEQAFGSSMGAWIVRTAPGQSDAVKAAVPAAVEALLDHTQDEKGANQPFATTGAEYREQKLAAMAGNVDVQTQMLSVFGAIALLVGAIIIATTFAILVAQRRRQIGLLRAVGASRGQVFRRFLAEALVLGVVGSLLGIAIGIVLGIAISTFATGSAGYGISIPWDRMALILLAGVVTTTLAALWPLRQTLRVKPLEALRPVSTERDRRRGRLAVGIVCALLLLGGFALAFVALNAGGASGILLAVGAAVLITLGVLGSASIYVPWLLAALGALFGLFGPTSRLAALNSRRNPGRAGATSVALMLAVGLIVTLQVGQASIKATAADELDRSYPIDLMARSDNAEQAQNKPFTADELRQVQAIPHVAGAALVRTLRADSVRPMELTPEVLKLLPAGTTAPDGTLLVSGERMNGAGWTNGQRVELRVDGKPHTVTVHSSNVGGMDGAVSAATFAQLGGKPAAYGLVIKLDDTSQAADVAKKVTRIIRANHPGTWVDGGALMKALLNQVLDIMLMIVLALLGVATLIALLGVGNTLGLSVLERTRESALLRALGLQASGLRVMLLVEAVLLSLVGALVGVAFGVFFGWLGTSAVIKAMGWSAVHLSFNWPLVLGVIGIALLAGVLGSILPGRRAARATPVEALADVG